MVDGKRVGVVLAVAVALTAAWRFPFAAADAYRGFDEGRSLSQRDRTLVPARAVDIDVGPLDAAAELIPPDSTYYVNVGQDFPFSHEVTRATVTPFAAYWLLPRRRATDLADAEWLLSYGATEFVDIALLREQEVATGVTVSKIR